MTSIDSITLEVHDPEASSIFYKEAYGLDSQVRLRESEAATSGFRGFTLSLVVAQPANADLLINAALDAGATQLKPATKSIWGYGGTLMAPDGTIWKVATSSKKNNEPASKKFDELVLLLGVDDVGASKKYYVDRGLAVGRSFGKMYVEFESSASAVKLALYRRKALAKDAGVSPEGSGSHRIVVNSDAGSFTDPDGFAWETTTIGR